MRYHVAALCALAISATHTAFASQSVDRRVQADAKGEVELSMTSGSVRCTGWDREEVRVTGTLASNVERLDLDRKGPTVTVHVVMRPHASSFDETRLDIKVPRTSSLRLATVSADIDVSAISGGQRLQTVSGDLITEADGADLELKSISGDLKVLGKNAPPAHLILSTVSGSVSVSGANGELDLDAVSGDTVITMATIQRARLKSVSGDLSLSGPIDRKARLDATTVSGDLSLTLSGADHASIEVESFSGEISPCFGSGVENARTGPGSSWRHKAPGAAEIHVKSMSGDIKVCNR